MRFRFDINGIRAIAVLAVIVFHFNPEWLPGGFAGVDVFFVVSGYLMTKIIMTGLERKQFSLLNFYVARAKRIFPVLIALCSTLLIFSWFYLTPIDYALLGKHVASSLGFISNIAYFRESGYFDAASHDKWLLHTWSLSVEWQFYIIYPLIIVCLKKIASQNFTRVVILSLALLSFIYSLLSSFIWPSNAFYLLPSRAWEMFFGGIVFLFPIKANANLRSVLQYSGISLIICSYLFLTKDNVWPGYFALLPVMGTMFVIWANSQTSLITNNYFFQRIGSASYSIYLWHWPIVVLFNHLDLIGWEYQAVGLISSLIVGYLSFVLIEKNLVFSFKRKTFLGLILYPPVCSLLIVGALASFIYFDKGISTRFNVDAIANIERSPKAYQCGSKIINTCNYFSQDIEWATLGNSHSVELAYALALKLEQQKIGLRQFSRAGCVMGYKRSIESPCVSWTNRAVEEIIKDSNVKNVVISYRYTSSLFGDNIATYPELPNEHPLLSNGITAEEGRNKIIQSTVMMINDLAKHKENVYVILPIPELSKSINKIAFHELLFRRKIENIRGTSLDYYLDRNHLVRESLLNKKFSDRVKFIDPVRKFCDKLYCYVFKDGVPLYWDDDHPSIKGAGLIAELILEKS